MTIRIAAGMIIFNGNYVLKECLESMYPHVTQILIAEGPVTYWQSQEFTTSTDGTNDILHEFYDPDKKIQIVHGQYNEKTEQANAYMHLLDSRNTYIWNLDCDEIFKSEDIKTIKQLLEKHKYTDVNFRSCTFVGGFEEILTGFEESAQFIRIRRVYPRSRWSKHRPPTIPLQEPSRTLGFDTLDNDYNIRMYHYSYVFPEQVRQKVQYYKAAISKDNCIDNFFEEVWLPWVLGNDEDKKEIEQKYKGIHEFKPNYRGECYSAHFQGHHPQVILDNMKDLQNKFNCQLQNYKANK